MGKLFKIVGIVEPGKVSLKLDGRFQEVNLYSLPDEKLKQLHDAKCSYVQATKEGMKEIFPAEKEIQVNPIKFNKTKK
jgi:hypothetical protein